VKSTLIAKETLVAAPRFPVIDSHIHPPMPLSAEVVAAWVRLMDSLQIETSFVMTEFVGERFEELARFFLPEYKSRFALFCPLDNTAIGAPDYSTRVVRELERCYRAGAQGVGELTDKGWGLESGLQALETEGRERLPRSERLHLDDARLDEVWERCAALGLPVSMHVADHPSAWQPLGPQQERGPAFARFNLAGQDVPSYYELLGRRDRLLARHPRTRFIACHLGNEGNDLAALGGAMDKFPNLYLDIAARDYELGRQPRAAREFLEQYRHRVLFGTDYGISVRMYQWWFRLLESEDEYMASPTSSWRVYGLGLSDQVLRDLYSENARRVLG